MHKPSTDLINLYERIRKHTFEKDEPILEQHGTAILLQHGMARWLSCVSRTKTTASDDFVFPCESNNEIEDELLSVLTNLTRSFVERRVRFESIESDC